MKTDSPLLRGKMLLIAGMLALSTAGFSQNPSVKVFEDWNTTSGTQNSFQRTVVRSKAFGTSTYYYLCGATLNSSGNYDMLVQKKNSSGTVLWTQTYAGAGGGDDFATDVQIDAVGNVYICGTYYKDATDSNNAIVIKYNTVGVHKWTNTFNGAGSRHDAASMLAVRTSEVYVVGTTWKGSTPKYDMLAIRYDSTGSLIWTQTWDHNSLFDVATNVNFTSKGLVMAGGAQSAVATYKYATVRLAYSDGSVVTSAVSSGTGFGFDQVTDLQTDVTGNVYITGGSYDISAGYNIRTVKLDTTLSILWQTNYDGGSSLNDMGTGLQLDQLGNVIVTGYRTSSTSGKDYVTIKYNSGGTQQWVSTFDGGVNANDSATCIVVSSTDTNKIYISGYSYNGSSKDYWTIKYDGAGNQKWEIGFNNLENSDDRATAITLDTLGAIVVAGQNKLNDSTYIYTTVKYVEKNTLLPDDTISVTSNSFIFTENRGQLLGTDSIEHPEVKFYCNGGSPSVYFQDTAVSFVFFKEDTSSVNVDSLFRIDMKYANANSDLKVRSMDVRQGYSNFYLAHIPDGRCRVQDYEQLITFNVWNNVDVLFGSNLKGLKTYFVCQPGGGGNPAAQIDLLFEAADSIRVDGSGQLIVYSPYGNVVHPKAAAWQIDGSGNFQSLGWQPAYNIVGTNEVKFTSFGSFNTAYPLIIAMDWGNEQFSTVSNPTWSTYLGSASTDYGYDIEYSNGEVYAIGNTPMSGFPVFSGFDLLHNGSHDVFVGCFDSNRARRWVSYYGGSSDDEGDDLAIVGPYVVCTGTTWGAGFPFFSPTGWYSESSLNVNCAYIMMLSTFNGYRTWATPFGRTHTWGTKVISDPSANGSFFIAGLTDNVAGNNPCGPPSNTGFPLCNPGSGAYYDGTPNGGYDGFLVRFANNGQLAWSTFFGGAGNDKVFDLVTDGTSLYAVGMTESSSGFPVQAPNVGSYYQSTYSGNTDGFLAQFDLGTLAPQWCTYIGGADYDVTTGVDIFSNKLYAVGLTGSAADATTCATPTAGGFPTCTNATSYSQPYNASAYTDAYILKFKSQDLVWGTYLGGTGGEGMTSFSHAENPEITHDNLDNVHLVLSSSSPENNLGSAAATQNNTGMNYNQNNCTDVSGGNYKSTETVLYTFTPQNQMLWGTYFGGIGVAFVPWELGEMPTAIACEGTNIIVTGYLCSTTQFPVVSPTISGFTQGATTVGPTSDVFISEFDISQIPNFTSDPQGGAQHFNVAVAPNPVENGVLLVTVNSSQTGNFDLTIFNVIGDAVYSHDNQITNNSTTEISIDQLSSGIYFVQVTDETGLVETVKIAIQR